MVPQLGGQSHLQADRPLGFKNAVRDAGRHLSPAANPVNQHDQRFPRTAEKFRRDSRQGSRIERGPAAGACGRGLYVQPVARHQGIAAAAERKSGRGAQTGD